MQTAEPIRMPKDLVDAVARGLAETSRDALVVVDRAGRIVFVNRQVGTLFGYAPDDVLGESLDLLVPDRLRDAHGASFADPSVTRSFGRDAGVVGRRADGSELAVEVTLSTLRVGRETFHVAAIRDATEAVDAARAVRDSEERFRLAFDGAPIGMALAGLDGRFVRANEAFCRLAGYSSEELVARTFQDITDPDDAGAGHAFAEALLHGRQARCELVKRYVRKDGRPVDVKVTGSIVRDAAGAPSHFFVLVEDIGPALRAAAALQRSEAQFRELVEQAAEAVVVADLDGRYLAANSAACRLLGYPLEELLRKNVSDVVPEEDLERLASVKAALLDEGREEVSEWNVRTKTGALVPVDVSAKIHADGRWVAFMRDATARKQHEHALRKSEASLASAQRAAHLGTWDWDLRTNHVERSKELLDLFGVEGPVSPRSWALSPYVPEEDREALRHVIEEAVREGRGYTLEHRITRPNGDQVIVLQHGEPIAQDGKTVRLVGTMLDVTERRRAEREREETLEWLRGVVAHSPVGLLLVRAGSPPVVEANDRAKALIGTPVDLAGTTQSRVRDAAGLIVAVEDLPGVRALAGETVVGAELAVRREDGRTVPILVSAGPIRGRDGGVQGAVVAFQDITSAKELERLRAEWSSVVGHDLRQPLNVIALHAQLLLRRPLEPETKRTLERVVSAGKRLERMVADLMDLSRLDARRLELDRRASDVVRLARDSLDRLALQTERPLELRTTSPSLVARLDADRVAQVLDNLLGNAAKYGTAGTPIVVSLEALDGVIRVSVSNEGAGIGPEEMPSLFQRFQRTSGARAARIKGTGLGLYIARELVEAHGGRLTVESVPGAQTTFRFTLPA